MIVKNCIPHVQKVNSTLQSEWRNPCKLPNKYCSQKRSETVNRIVWFDTLWHRDQTNLKVKFKHNYLTGLTCKFILNDFFFCYTRYRVSIHIVSIFGYSFTPVFNLHLVQLRAQFHSSLPTIINNLLNLFQSNQVSDAQTKKIICPLLSYLSFPIDWSFVMRIKK